MLQSCIEFELTGDFKGAF